MRKKSSKTLAVKDQSISLVLCGAAGSGVQTVEQLLIKIFKSAGYHVCATKEYMSRIRGGSNSTEIRLSSRPVRAPIQRVDIAVLLDKEAFSHISPRLSRKTVVIGDTAMIGNDRPGIVDVPFSKIALEAGNKLYANNVAVSVVASLLAVSQETAIGSVQNFFAKKTAEIIAGNCEAIRKGYAFAQKLIEGGQLKIVKTLNTSPSADEGNDHILANGAQAVGLGAVAGGCNFIGSYPMSPGTGVLTFLSANARRFGIVAEQAEDEISAINMAIGAGYAGGRGMVTTSGGGFALMTEGVSLAGMIEVPVVIHVGQRPGPATGLPTRTGQEDLELVLHAGHGEFPRAIFAPGDLEEAFELTGQAFDIADQYQTPVFILTDQHLMDIYYDCPAFKTRRSEIKLAIIKTEKDYRRYALTKNGISPRGIPGYGEGLVLVDSDEHDEWGRITEEMSVRNAMVEKRLKKLVGMRKEAVAPTLLGPKSFKNLLVCWGSTKLIVKEAWESLGRKDTAVMHFSQVYPIHKSAAAILRKARRVFVIENNATGQFARLLQEETGAGAYERILKYDGLPFFADELSVILQKVMAKGGRR